MPVTGVPLPVAGVAVAVPMDPWMVSAEAMGIPVVEMMLRGSGFCAPTVGMFATGGVVGDDGRVFDNWFSGLQCRFRATRINLSRSAVVVEISRELHRPDSLHSLRRCRAGSRLPNIKWRDIPSRRFRLVRRGLSRRCLYPDKKRPEIIQRNRVWGPSVRVADAVAAHVGFCGPGAALVCGGTSAASPPENGASDLMLTALGTAYVTEQCRVLAEQWARPAAAVYLALADSEAMSGGPFETKLWQAAVDLFEKQHKQKQNWLWNFSLQRVAEEFRGRGGGPNVKNARTPADVMYRLLAPQFVQKCTQVRAIHEHEKVRGCADGGLRERLDSEDWRLRWFRKVLEGEGTLPFIVEHVRAFAEEKQPSSVGGREQLSEVVANLDWCVGYGRHLLEAEAARKPWTTDADDADDLTRETAAADAAAEREGLEPLEQTREGEPLEQTRSGSHSDEYRAGACVSKGDNFSGANTTSFLWRPESGWQCVPEGPADSREEGIAMGLREKLASVREKHSLKFPDGSGPDGERAGPGEPYLFTLAGPDPENFPPARTPERPLVSPEPLVLSPKRVPGAENFVYPRRYQEAPGGGSGPGSSDDRTTEGARSSEHFRSQGTSSAIPLSLSGLIGEKDTRKKTRAAEKDTVEALAATECAEEAPGSGAGEHLECALCELRKILKVKPKSGVFVAGSGAGSGRSKSTIGPASKDLPLPSGFMRTAGGACKPRGRTALRVAELLPTVREEDLDLLDTPPRHPPGVSGDRPVLCEDSRPQHAGDRRTALEREDTRTAQQVLHAILGHLPERAWPNALWLRHTTTVEQLLRGVERDFAALDVYWAVPEEQELQLFQERALARLNLLPDGSSPALFNKEARLHDGASGGHRTCGLRWLLPDYWSREIDGFEAHHRKNGTWENNRRAQEVFRPPPDHPHIPTKVLPRVYSPEKLRGSEHWRGPVEVLATLAKEFVFQCKLIAEFQRRDAAALQFFRRVLVTDATLQLVALHLKKYRNSQYLDDTSPGYRHLTKVWEDLRQCGRYGVALLSEKSEKTHAEASAEAYGRGHNRIPDPVAQNAAPGAYFAWSYL
eukprot:g12706.t1